MALLPVPALVKVPSVASASTTNTSASAALPISPPPAVPSKPRQASTSTQPSATPRPPAPVRADTDMMIPSDSDEEAPAGGYYVKSRDPTSLLRGKTVTQRRTSKAAENLPTTGLGIALAGRPVKTSDPPKIKIVDNPPLQSQTSSPAYQNMEAPIAGSHGGGLGGLFRRRTAPTRRKADVETIARPGGRAPGMIPPKIGKSPAAVAEAP